MIYADNICVACVFLKLLNKSITKIQSKMKKSDFLHRSAKRFSLLLIVSSIMISGLYAQNMSRYITLNVANDTLISIDLAADSANTPIKIASGDWDTIITAGTSWTGYIWYPFHDTIMTTYGDVKWFDCMKNYTNLTGIDVSHNKTLVSLLAPNNDITSLDVSGCTKLEYLGCYDNPSLTTLKVSGCTSLKNLDCHNTALTTLDVSACKNLIYLDCYDNPSLTILKVSGCTSLKNLYCYNTALTTLDVSACKNLRYLDCYDNPSLTTLKVSGCTSLKKLYCYNSALTTLDVSNCIFLENLYCSNNKLTSLGLTNCINLSYLYCDTNVLTSLNVADCINLSTLYCFGNDFSTESFDDLMCSMHANGGEFYPLYSVSDSKAEIFSKTNGQNAIDKGWKIRYRNDDAILAPTIGTATCGAVANMSNAIKLNVIKDTIVKFGLIANRDNMPIKVVSGTWDTSLIIGTTLIAYEIPTFADTMIIYGYPMGLLSFSGIGGEIIGIDASNNVSLQGLEYIGTDLSTLNLKNCPSLVFVNCADNALKSLNVSGCTSLGELDCSNNELTKLDVSGLIKLKYLYCENNALTSLKINGIDLEVLYCGGNKLSVKGYDSIMCYLPERDEYYHGEFYPVINTSDTLAYKSFMQTNANNAIAKYWDIMFSETGNDLPQTIGSYECNGLSIEEIEEALEIVLYPNPAKTMLNIENATEDVHIFDITGRMVMKVNNYGETLLQINVSNLSRGMYFVRIGNYTTKFVKE